MASSSFQGKTLLHEWFPAPADEEQSFYAKSLCLIDLGNTFLVETSGDVSKPHQVSIFRLQKRRDLINIDDSVDQVSKEQCMEKIRNKFALLPMCSIVGTFFPYFDECGEERCSGKERPCIAIHGPEGSGQMPLYIAVYVGSPSIEGAARRDEETISNTTISLTPANDLQPSHARDLIVDCSKIVALPEVYKLSYEQQYEDQSTYFPWKIDPKQKRNKNNILKLTDPQSVRTKVLNLLLQLALNNPHIDYVDQTLQYDVGTWMKLRKKVDGEWRTYRMKYHPQGNPSTSSASLAVEIPNSLENSPHVGQTPTSKSKKSNDVHKVTPELNEKKK